MADTSIPPLDRLDERCWVLTSVRAGLTIHGPAVLTVIDDDGVEHLTHGEPIPGVLDDAPELLTVCGQALPGNSLVRLSIYTTCPDCGQITGRAYATDRDTADRLTAEWWVQGKKIAPLHLLNRTHRPKQ